MVTEHPDGGSPAGSDDPFPAPVYSATVLAPLFDNAKRHFADAHRAIDRAHLVMLVETGILDRSDSAAIAGALAAIENGVDLESVAYTGEFEDFFFLIEAELKNRLGPDLAGRLHTARSRNDMDHTIFRMKLKGLIDTLAGKALALTGALIDKAEAEKATIIVAYTHGQPAQPTTFGHYLSAAIEVLLRDITRLLEARAVVDFCPMGAAAITTSGFAIDRNRMAELLGFAAPLQNSYGCIATVDYVTATYSALKLIFLHLGRLIQDLQFWTAFEVGQLHVPDGYVQISSIMPQKRNPVPVEHLRYLASVTIGRADMVVGTMHNTPFTDMNDSEGAMQIAGYTAFESGGRVLDLLAGLIAAVSVNAERVRANIDASCITVTELADTLVREDGLSFRQAHEIAAATSTAVVAAKSSLSKAGYGPFCDAFQAATGRASSLDEVAFQTAVSPEHFIAVRDRFGGPAPAALDAALAGYRGEADRFQAQLNAASAHEKAATRRCHEEFSKLREQAD